MKSQFEKLHKKTPPKWSLPYIIYNSLYLEATFHLGKRPFSSKKFCKTALPLLLDGF
jgi:hypothetical protein